jgi:hypothetical protein
MQQTKSHLQSQWEVTDLGNPTKIIGIEITQTDDSITISQKAYIKSILQRGALTNCMAQQYQWILISNWNQILMDRRGTKVTHLQDFSESSNSWQIAHDLT